jgi:UDP-glucose:(heptosyl)LPS alpha-1,3-glucosyltransferase
MRIALVVHEYNRRFGHSRYVVELAERFAREHEVHVFANRADESGADGITIHHVPAIRTNSLTTILSFLVAAARLVDRRRFDVVHAQGLVVPTADVITAHICLASWFAALREQAVGSTWRQRLFERLLTPMDRALYRRRGQQGWTIAISAALRAELRQHYGRTERVEVIHHGVDLRTFTPPSVARRAAVRGQYGVGAAERLALFVGDLRKGATQAIEAVARTADVCLALVSRSDDAEYRRYAESLGLAGRVRFWPATERVQDCYAAADVFLFPTPYDAFGMVITEAMASGMAVITTRRAGAAELIEHGTSGFVVDDERQVDAMARHLEAVVADDELRARIGAGARARVEQQSWDDVARRTLEVYERAARRRVAADR